VSHGIYVLYTKGITRRMGVNGVWELNGYREEWWSTDSSEGKRLLCRDFLLVIGRRGGTKDNKSH
jgi:hypothetical protein